MDECTFNDYKTHLTVNNYGHEMINIRCEPFMEEFDKQYAGKGPNGTDIKFADINLKVHVS